MNKKIIVNVCICCKEEHPENKGRFSFDTVTNKQAWFCWECHNTVMASRKFISEQEN